MADENGAERRRDERHGRVDRVTLRPLEAPEGAEIEVAQVSCMTVDISAGGFCLRSNEAVETDQQVEICAQVLGNPIKYYLKGTVLRCTAFEDGYALGIELEERPGADLRGWQALFEE